ncbi:NAR1 ribosyltransferase, partial [Formicarius rufipectus]|nr:NAR1 ribosyltransferase [Formicarius rufipectus]
LALLAGTVTAVIQELPLTMAPDSFDDQYLNCHQRMLAALPALNRSEFRSNPLFARVWGRAAAATPPVWSPLGRWEEAVALRAYTMMDDGLYQGFNAAVRGGGGSRRRYLDRFHYKVLHFLLTAALRDLRKALPASLCLHTYRGFSGTRFTARPGQQMRFGHFVSGSSDQSLAKRFGNDTIFEVWSCHGAPVWGFSDMPHQNEFLIPPFETFTVTAV